MKSPDDCTLSDVVQELRTLTKFMKTRHAKQKQRFPFACKNGRLCPYLACNSCWFKHDDVEPTEVNGKKEHPDAAQAAFDKNVAVMKAAVDKKIQDFTKHMDERMYCIESKLDALAQCVSKNDEEIQQLEIQVCSDTKALSKPTHELMREIDCKMDQKLEDSLKGLVQDAFRAAFEATEDFEARVEGKIDAKLASFLESSVKDSFEAAIKVFACHVCGRIFKIEAELGITSAGDTDLEGPGKGDG